MTICIRCIVKGRVQGVFFRASTQEQAQKLNLQGWAKNLPDGSVEVIACGEQQALEQLQHWLHQGSPMASVVSVDCAPAEFTPYPTDFSIY